MGRFFYQQTGIHTVEGKILKSGNADIFLYKVHRMLNHRTPFIDLIQVQCRGDKPGFHHIQRKNRFDGATGSHGVTSVTLQPGNHGESPDTDEPESWLLHVCLYMVIPMVIYRNKYSQSGPLLPRDRKRCIKPVMSSSGNIHGLPVFFAFIFRTAGSTLSER
jgi:hypothetical protein